MTLNLGRLGLVVLCTVACAHAPAPPANEAPAPAGPVPTAAPESSGGVAAAGKLHGYLVKLKCGAPQDSRSCKLSSDQERSRLDVVLAGDAGRLYDVKVRVRGLVEPRRYSGGALLDPGNK